MSESIQSVMGGNVWAALLLVFLLAWLEYVFPPVPGDSTMLFGFFLVGAGAVPLPGVMAAALLGSVLGAFTAYACGARLGRSYFFLKSAWARQELSRIEGWFERFGPRLLLINRFIPGVRGLFLYAAGIGRMGIRPVAFYSTASNVLWVTIIAWGGTSLGTTWEEVRVVFQRYVYAIAVLAGVYVVLSFLRSRRRRRATLTPSS